MQDNGVRAGGIFNRWAGPVRWEMGLAEEKKSKQEAERPADNNDDETKSDSVEGDSRLLCEDAPVKEDKTELHKPQRWDLYKFYWPECLRM